MTALVGTQLREIDLVERCLGGCENAIAEVKSLHNSHLEMILMAYGASGEEAGEVVRILWLDCLVGHMAKDPLFRRYNGSAALRNWLGTIAINRWISLKRAESVRQRALGDLSERNADIGPPRVPLPDPEVGAILEQAIRGAFASCTAEEIVMLRLVHFHRLNQKEVAALWGWTESKMSRSLNRLQEFIADDTLRRVRRVDENLDICWEDFLRLCDGLALLQDEV
jgi:RNA polymerase sigma factor (sigma-70 family)